MDETVYTCEKLINSRKSMYIIDHFRDGYYWRELKGKGIFIAKFLEWIF